MTSKPVSPIDAATLFVRETFDYGYGGAVRATRKLLEQGPPGRKPNRELVELHEWFQKLDTASQDAVRNVVERAAYSAVFGCLVIIDNKRSYPLQGQVSDWALYLQSYGTEEKMWRNESSDMVRINMSYTPEPDLNELFQSLSGERSTHEP